MKNIVDTTFSHIKPCSLKKKATLCAAVDQSPGYLINEEKVRYRTGHQKYTTFRGEGEK